MEAVSRFARYLQRRAYATHTVDNYLLDIKLFFAHTDKSPTQVTRHDIEAFLDQQLTAGLSPVTLNRRLFALQHFFEFVADQQPHPMPNPVRRTHFLRRPRCLPRPFKAEELKRFFAAVDDLRDRAIFTLMLRTGLRVSEVAQLQVEDVDLQAGTIFVHQGKGQRDRMVYLSADALELLRQCLAKRPKLSSRQLFWNHKRKGQRLSSKAIQKAAQRYCAKAGIEGNCHRFRHTFATQLLEHGAQMLTVRDCLGHSSIMSSVGYTQLSNQTMKREYYCSMERVMQQLKLTDLLSQEQDTKPNSSP